MKKINFLFSFFYCFINILYSQQDDFSKFTIYNSDFEIQKMCYKQVLSDNSNKRVKIFGQQNFSNLNQGSFKSVLNKIKQGRSLYRSNIKFNKELERAEKYAASAFYGLLGETPGTGWFLGPASDNAKDIISNKYDAIQKASKAKYEKFLSHELSLLKKQNNHLFYEYVYAETSEQKARVYKKIINNMDTVDKALSDEDQVIANKTRSRMAAEWALKVNVNVENLRLESEEKYQELKMDIGKLTEFSHKYTTFKT